jgi:protein O-mannosyl-transferase
MSAKKQKGFTKPKVKGNNLEQLKVVNQNNKLELFKERYYSRFWIPMLILIFIGVILYLPTIEYEYVLDDKIVITDNNYVKKGYDGIWEILSTESFQGYFGEQKDLLVGARYRPLSIVTFAIEYEFFGLNPRIGHIVNIVLYILTVLLLMRILFVLFKKYNNQQWFWSVPFIGALFFLLHPIHTEVVANIKGRDEIMTLLGALGAMYFYLRYLDDQKKLWLIAMSISYFLGLLSKENALTFLAIIPVTGYFFVGENKKAQFRSFAILLGVSVIYLYIRSSVIGYFLDGGTEVKALMNNPFLEMNGAQKYATIMYTLGYYLKLLFFPHPLTHDYYPYHIPIMEWSNFKVLISLVLYSIMFFIMVKGYKNRAVFSYLVFFYLASLSIVSNIVFPVGTFMNERFIYISSISFCVLMAIVLIRTIPSQKWGLVRGLPIVSLLILIPYLVGFTYKTWDRIPDWKNGFDLNKSAVEVSKNSARANMFMGTAYFNKYKEEEDVEKKKEYLLMAKPYIVKSLEIHPNYGDGLTMIGGVAAEMYKIDQNLDSLLEAFYIVLTRRPSQQYANEYLDYMIRNRFDPEKQEAFYFRLGYEHYYKKEQRMDIAIIFLKKGLEIVPNSARLNKALAMALDVQGNQMESRIYHTRANSILPGIAL